MVIYGEINIYSVYKEWLYICIEWLFTSSRAAQTLTVQTPSPFYLHPSPVLREGCIFNLKKSFALFKVDNYRKAIFSIHIIKIKRLKGGPAGLDKDQQ